MTTLEVLFTPADFADLRQRNLSRTVCVVFDVLRATTSVVTALAHGATAILPAEDIPSALACRRRHPKVLLAGERNGVRIEASLTGGTDFDLGNSPREFVPERVGHRSIVMTTTNGTRALRACASGSLVLVACFLNLGATAAFLRAIQPPNLLLVCSGTFEQAAYEDILGAGALADLLWDKYAAGEIADSALLARQLYQLERSDLIAGLTKSRNGQRLLSRPDLRDDVAFCAERDMFPLVAIYHNGVIRRRR